MATSLCTAFLFIRISVICINKNGGKNGGMVLLAYGLQMKLKHSIICFHHLYI